MKKIVTEQGSHWTDGDATVSVCVNCHIDFVNTKANDLTPVCSSYCAESALGVVTSHGNTKEGGM